MSQHRVDRKSWHYRIYEWWYNHKYPGFYNCSRKTGTNLCPYVRAILFWAPFRFIFWNWAAVYEWGYNKYISLNMLTIPFLLYTVPTLAGYESWKLKHALWKVEGVIALVLVAAAAAIGLIYGLSCLVDWVEAKLALRPKKVKTPSRFAPLVRDYLRSAHDGICPEIIFDGGCREEECHCNQFEPPDDGNLGSC